MRRDQVHAALHAGRDDQVRAVGPLHVTVGERHRLGQADGSHRVEQAEEIDLQLDAAEQAAPALLHHVDPGARHGRAARRADHAEADLADRGLLRAALSEPLAEPALVAGEDAAKLCLVVGAVGRQPIVQPCLEHGGERQSGGENLSRCCRSFRVTGAFRMLSAGRWPQAASSDACSRATPISGSSSISRGEYSSASVPALSSRSASPGHRDSSRCSLRSTGTNCPTSTSANQRPVSRIETRRAQSILRR